MVTIRLLGAESNGINNYGVDEPDYNGGPLDLNHTSIQRERPGQSGHRQAALLYGLVLNNYDMALLKNEVRSLAYEVILAERPA